MGNDYEIFSKDYVSGSETKSEVKEIESTEHKDIEIDSIKYSTSKPRRRIIRAKLIYAKN